MYRKIKSYCKVNFFLKILKKIKIGLHDIQTYTSQLDLYDEIKISETKNKKDVVIFKGKFKKLVKKSKNSVLDALSALRSRKLINLQKNYRIIIDKRIPVFSGLGGGSSNAAFVIKYFTKNKIKQKDLEFFKKKIGTDFSLFFSDQTFVENLKKIKKSKINFTLNIVLVYPYIRCSTKKIYNQVKNFTPSSKVNFSKIKSKNKFINLVRKERNELQGIVINNFYSINKILNFISIQRECYFSRITGSGSVCFGIFKSEKSAKLALKRIKKKFPKYWAAISKTI